MNKHILNAFLLGTIILSCNGFTSCNDDVDELKSRMSVVEIAIDDIKSQLQNALVTGASITKVEQKDDGSWNITLSNGQTIEIKNQAGGGSNISVVVTDTNAVITIDGQEYILPLGASVSSLVYVPETLDGIVEIGNDGAVVKFLVRPSLNSLDGAEFSIAESHAVTRAGDGEQFKVNGQATLDNGFISVPLKALNVEAGNHYAISLQMNMRGTVIGSNYFNVHIAEDFSFIGEQIGGYEIKSEYNPASLDENYSEMTVNGVTLLKNLNFKDFFSQLPENAEFRIAGIDQQPVGDAQNKYTLLANSLQKDGTWAFAERPGTSFNSNQDRPGFLFNIVSNDVVKAKIYLKIIDELADVAFNAGLKQAEAEWGGREKSLSLGAQTIDIQATFTNYESDYTIIHSGKDDFFAKWSSIAISTPNEDNIIYCDGTKLVLGDLGAEYAAKSRGIYWFYRGFAIYVPETLAVEDGKYIGTNGKSYAGGEGYDYDLWLGSYSEYINNPTTFYDPVSSWNFKIDEQTGVITLPETYTGYGFRIGVGAGYEYAYGVKKIGEADQFGLFFFNRRLAPEGATMPAPKE